MDKTKMSKTKCQECGAVAEYELTYPVHAPEHPEGFTRIYECGRCALELEAKFKNTPSMNNLIVKRI